MNQTIREAFLADIIANKAEDAPRLIFADWLEENGETERAEFIRLQMEIFSRWKTTERNEHLFDPDWNRLRRREMVLFEEFGGEWFGATIWPDGTLRDVAWGGVHYHSSRGFLFGVTCTASDFLLNADDILKAQPIEEVNFTGRTEFTFSPAERMEFPGKPGEARQVASWRVYLNGNQVDRVCMEISYPIRQRPAGHAIREFMERVERERTVEGYLRMKFGKGIKFKLPEPVLSPDAPFEPMENFNTVYNPRPRAMFHGST